MGSTLTGASNVTCTAAFIANLRYQWMPTGVVETQVSVGPTNPFINHVFSANAYTGISMYDPDSAAASATITAYDLNGNTVGSAAATVPALGKTIGNLNKLIPTLPSSFQGKVAITANDGIEVVALDVTPGAGSFVLGNVPVVHYNPQGSSHSGTYSFISGPQSGQTGTFTITNISPVGDLFGEASYLGTASNTTVAGPVNIVEFNNGQVFLRFMRAFTPLAHAGGALTQQSDGSCRVRSIWRVQPAAALPASPSISCIRGRLNAETSRLAQGGRPCGVRSVLRFRAAASEALLARALRSSAVMG